MSRRGGGPRYSEYDERDVYDRSPGGVRLRERDIEETDVYSRRSDRVPDFLRQDYRREEQGPLVLRERRPRERSPSEVRISERIVERERERSPSPPPVERVRSRIIERREPSQERVRRVVETRERIRERSPSPVVIRERVVERVRSPSPPPVERIRTRIVEREKEREPTPSPSPSPPPAPIMAPPIHQEIITHHRHIDHGM